MNASTNNRSSLGPDAFAALQTRRQAFQRCLDDASVVETLVRIWYADHRSPPFPAVCPCCGYPTLSEPAVYDICYLCGWEDDGQDDLPAGDADKILGGPNFDYSLTEARANFVAFRTQYRPGEARGFFEREAWSLPARRAIIAAYDSLLPAPSVPAFTAAQAEIYALFLALLECEKHYGEGLVGDASRRDEASR